MKTFVVRLFLFFSLVFIVLSGLLVYYYKTIQEFVLERKVISVLVVGDSYTQNGVDIESYLESSLNLSNSAETYFFSEQKLRFLINNGVKIDKVVLAAGDHGFLMRVDTAWVNNKLLFLDKTRTYWPLLNPSSVGEIFTHLELPYFTYFELIPELFYQALYTMERRFLMNRPPFLGGYSENNASINIHEKSPNSFANGMNYTGSLSKTQQFSLQKIIQLCNQSNINLFLLNTPQYFGGRLKSLPDLTGTYKVLDFGDLFTGRGELFADFEHLNAKGAAIFTDTLVAELSKY